MPPPATGGETPVANAAGFSMAFPESWIVATNPRPGGYKALTSGRPASSGQSTTRMGATIAYIPKGRVHDGGSAWRSLRPHKTMFQGRPAVIRAGVYTHSLPLSQNLKRVWEGRSLGRWKSYPTTAHWYLEFERAGETISLFYRSACGSSAHVDPATIPPEIMSYFETFEYDPDEQSDVID